MSFCTKVLKNAKNDGFDVLKSAKNCHYDVLKNAKTFTYGLKKSIIYMKGTIIMERSFIKNLDEWFKKKEKMPLMVFGARQVGKTYLINEFCQNCGKEYYKFDLLEQQEIKDFFENSINIREAITVFALANNIDLKSNNIIIFFDEIQKSEKLIESLKYFHTNYPNIDIIAAGSLLGVSLKKLETSFPLGYVEEQEMFPLNFQEFLNATGNTRFIPIIEDSYKKNKPIDATIHKILINLFNKFLLTGGMPRVVQNFLDNNQDISSLDFNIQSDIIAEYNRNVAKYNHEDKEKLRITRIYNAIIPELAKENPKFTYAKLDKKDNRKSDYITALDWLTSSNVILKCNQVTNPVLPLVAYENENSYKLFMNDIGLLSYKSEINRGIIISDGDYPFKGRLAENYVACELASNNIKLLYYTKKNTNNNGMEIDFLLQNEDGVIPIEVKAGLNTNSRSLNFYLKEFNPKYAIRISSKNFGFENNIKSVPLYAVFCIKI